MRNYVISSIAIFVMFCSGCSQSNIGDMLLGTWDVSLYLSPSQVAKISEDSFPNDLSIEMTMSGTQTYHLGGKYDGTVEFTIRLKFEEEEIPLRFLAKETGSWEIHGNVLVETTANSVITPLDDLTRKVVKKSPEFQTMVTPIAGESQSTKIIHISKTVAELQMIDPPYWDMTLRKKS
ncbi:MAG: hypothetical protein JXC36_06340 [Candidatus Atribacteria bacterium]|nr:hypothetical protein [Candidatus Atribacteria bacterium]